MLFERLGMIYFILISFLDLAILYFCVNFFLKIQDKWKRIYAETPSGYNLFLGVLLPTALGFFIVIPSIFVLIIFKDYIQLEISDAWAVTPHFLLMIYCVIYKSEEISKVYSKVDKRKLSE